jgi:hypothetical protein
VLVSQDVDPERRLHPAAHSRTDMAGARWLSQVTELLALLQSNVVPAAPFHALSALLGGISPHLGREGIKVLQAAMNPVMGSNASSSFASAFKSYAIVSAQHVYSAQWQSATRRSELAGLVRLVDTLKRLMLVRTVDQMAAEGARAADSLPEISAACWSSDAISARNLKLASVLRPVLEGFRVLLSRSWSADTVHRETVLRSQWSTGNPQGQCGVSSAWLAEILAREYSVRSTLCRGSLVFDEDKAESLLDHCWLEIDGGKGTKIIVDLTCDQARGFNRQIVFDAKADLERQQIRYIALDRMAVSDLDRNPVWPRYCSLRRNAERVRTPYELKVEASQCLSRFARHVEASSEVIADIPRTFSPHCRYPQQ